MTITPLHKAIMARCADDLTDYALPRIIKLAVEMGWAQEQTMHVFDVMADLIEKAMFTVLEAEHEIVRASFEEAKGKLPS